MSNTSQEFLAPRPSKAEVIARCRGEVCALGRLSRARPNDVLIRRHYENAKRRLKAVHWSKA